MALLIRGQSIRNQIPVSSVVFNRPTLLWRRVPGHVVAADDRKPSGASPMDSEHRDLVTKTRALIETTRREILQLREEIESARTTVDRTQRLLSRTEPSNRIARPAKAL